MQATLKFVLTLSTAFAAIATANPVALHAQGGGPGGPGGPGAGGPPAGAGGVGRGGGAGGGGQQQPQALVWAPKPTELTPYEAPNRPHWKLSDVLALNEGKASWRQPIVRNSLLEADYVQLAPGEKTPRVFYGDNRSWFIVWDGQIRVSIDGVEPFVATKGFMVQIPLRVAYTLEAIGDTPSLHFETRIAYAPLFYTIEETPPVTPGVTWYRAARIASRPAQLNAEAAVPTYSDGSRVYLDFQKEITEGQGPGRTGAFVSDVRGFANIIRGRGGPPPAATDLGHFHTYGTEFWFIMEGQIDYQIEGLPELISSFAGDIVTAERGRFHRASAGGDGIMSTRIAINGYPDPNGLHIYQTPAGQ